MPGPISVASISCPQSALPTPLRYCQATGPGGNGVYLALPRGSAVQDRRILQCAAPGPAWHLLSSRVLCSTLSVRTFTFSEVLRGRRGVIRLTAAVLRKRLARPRVGELSQLGRGRGSVPPMARACMGRCGGERRPDATQQSQDPGPLMAPLICEAGEWDSERAPAGWAGGPAGAQIPLCLRLTLHLLQPSLHSASQGPVSRRDSAAGGMPHHTRQFMPPPTAREPAWGQAPCLHGVGDGPV